MKGAPRKSPEQYDEEYQALQSSMEDYLRRQVEMLAKSGQAAGGTGGRESAWSRYRPDIYFAITLVLIGLLAWRILWPPQGSSDNSPATAQQDSGNETTSSNAPPTTPPPSGTEAAEADVSQPPAGFDDPAAFWTGYVEANRATVADWLVAVSEARGLASGAVSDLQKGNFKRYAESVRAGTESDTNRTNCRTGIFEYIYGSWAKQKGGATASAWKRVDLLVDQQEYPTEALSALLAELEVDGWFETVERKDPKVQIAVILAWLESHQP